jgi:hypothetical protein
MRALLVVLALTLTGCGMEYSDGTRVGVIKKFSKKGFMCKTWEGEMLLSAENVMQPETWNFSVESDKVAEEIKAALSSGKRVELVYIQKLFNPPCTPESSYRVQEVRK